MSDFDQLLQAAARDNQEIQRLRQERAHLLDMLTASRNLNGPLEWEDGKHYIVLGRKLTGIEYAVLQGIMRGWPQTRIGMEVHLSHDGTRHAWARLFEKFHIPKGKSARAQLMAIMYQEAIKRLTTKGNENARVREGTGDRPAHRSSDRTTSEEASAWRRVGGGVARPDPVRGSAPVR